MGSTSTAEGRTRVRHLACTEGLGASLAFYPAGRQARHAHDFTQISFLLAGDMIERQSRREYSLSRPARGVKPAGEPHENAWGRDGALIFSIKVAGGAADELPEAGEAGWSARPSGGAVAALIRACLAPGGAAERTEAARDLVALAVGADAALSAPPLWLERARQAMTDSPELVLVEQAAREAGVHRVHFSRLFHRAYGLPPSLFRKRAMVGRAVRRLLLTPAPMRDVAAAAGFSDQAHMVRSMAAATGLTPGALRRHLA